MNEWFWVTTDEAIAAINSAIDISDGNAEDTTKAIKFSLRCNMGLQCPIPDYHPAAWWTLWIPDLPPPKAPQSGNANGKNAPEKMKIERLDKGVPYEVAYDAAMNLSRQDRKRLVIDILKLI